MTFNSFPIPTNDFISYAGTLTGTLSWGCVLSPVTLQLSSNITFNGVQDAAHSSIWQSTALFGAAVQAFNGIISPNQINIGGDAVDTTTSGNGNLIGLSVNHAASANHTGGREAVQGKLNIVGSPALAAGAAGYVGVQGVTRINSNLGGTTGAYTNYKGGVFAGNSNVFAQSGATFLNLINGHEFDVSLPTGASAADKYGISVVKTSADAVRGTYDDSAISINDQDGASTTWTNGVSFGSYAHKWAFGTDSTLIAAQSRQTGPASTSVALYGCDFSGLTITAGGAAYLAPLLTPASSAATGKQGSICWDANFIYVCTASNTWKRVAIATW